MNLSFQHLLPPSFSPHSKVWIYQSSRKFSIAEALEIESELENFANNWLSHGQPVKGFGTLLFGQFIVLMADEAATGVSGCSTDSSVRVIKKLEQAFAVQLFDRTTLAFVIKDAIELLPLSQVNYAYENGFIHNDTLFFNNVVLTKADMEQNWIISVANSWLARKLSIQV